MEVMEEEDWANKMALTVAAREMVAQPGRLHK